VRETGVLEIALQYLTDVGKINAEPDRLGPAEVPLRLWQC